MDDLLLRQTRAKLKIALGERELLNIKIDMMEKEIIFLEKEMEQHKT